MGQRRCAKKMVTYRKGVIFYFNPFEKCFSQVDPLGKLIPFLDLGKGARLGGALGELQGARSLSAPLVHMGWGLPRWTIGC
jgi:hypothetical protein